MQIVIVGSGKDNSCYWREFLGTSFLHLYIITMVITFLKIYSRYVLSIKCRDPTILFLLMIFTKTGTHVAYRSFSIMFVCGHIFFTNEYLIFF